MRSSTSTNLYRPIKRLIDLIVSVVLLALFSPILLAAMIAIKLTSPGPIFFFQIRGGRGGRPFWAWKLRTMHIDHRHDPNETVPLTHAGITNVGRVLRRTKIDELPQLINVLKGDMSLIGPRPTIMEQVQAYDSFQRRRLEVRPGITGLAQINGNTAIPWDERIRYDVYYVDHLSLGFDLYILAKTFLVLPQGESHYARPFNESPYQQSP